MSPKRLSMCIRNITMIASIRMLHFSALSSSTAYIRMISYIRASLQIFNSNGILAYEMFTNTLQLFTNYLLILGCLRITAYSRWVPPPGGSSPPPLGSPLGTPSPWEAPPRGDFGAPFGGRGALTGFSGTWMR